LGLLAEVFDLDKLGIAFDAVLFAAKGARRGAISGSDKIAARSISLKRNKSVIIQRIHDRHELEGVIQFQRFITKIPKKPEGPPERQISLFSFEERVILRSMLNILWPLLEPVVVPTVSFCTFRQGGYHPPRGIAQAVLAISEERKNNPIHIFKTDISSFFDYIDQSQLLKQTENLIADSDFNLLVAAQLKAETVYDHRYYEVGDHMKLEGIPQGSALSPLLACTYLSPFDKKMQETGMRLFRYVDDLVVLCATREESRMASRIIRQTLKGEYGLSLSKTKTKHVKPESPLTFLGHKIYPDGRLYPDQKRVRSVKSYIFSIIESLPGISDHDAVELLTSYLLGFFISMGHCDFREDNYRDFASMIGDALDRRGLNRDRLSRLLKRKSKKWPIAFLEGLP
jgi:hypothetical protein